MTAPLSPDRAFALFTDGYGSWWPHRHFERHGAGGAGIQAGVSSHGGWATILEDYAKAAAAA